MDPTPRHFRPVRLDPQLAPHLHFLAHQFISSIVDPSRMLPPSLTPIPFLINNPRSASSKHR
ncbi:hypothetical protein B0H19DRAFT_1196178 [Mycena capillaripes]|nr:hypothetical protein B0H19DRAFT_1196178 [Mycena capillaripes]